MIAELIGITSILIWLYLMFARGEFWRVSNHVLGSLLLPALQPAVAAVIPARNEAEVVEQSLLSVLAQDYRGDLHVFLVDDHSSDGTASLAKLAADKVGRTDQVAVVRSAALPPGWTGKLWAVSQGIDKARVHQPEFIWLTDADVVHGPQTLRTLVANAATGGFDLVSLMVKLRCESWAERAFIPAFVFFFFKLYPPKWVASPAHGTAAAAGGCMLIRATTLARSGGIESIRNQLIDDCALARQVKRVGRTWMGLTRDSHSIHGYGGWADVGRMISRSAFTQLRHSTLLLLGTLAGLAMIYLAPPTLLWFDGWPRICGIAAWVLMTITFIPMLRFYGRSPLWAVSLPLIAAFYAAATLHSALQYWRGRGGKWKDRVQDPVS